MRRTDRHHCRQTAKEVRRPRPQSGRDPAATREAEKQQMGHDGPRQPDPQTRLSG